MRGESASPVRKNAARFGMRGMFEREKRTDDLRRRVICLFP
jgi:hypothetical protein